MAKNKAPLTPEQAEVKAMKKEKNSQNGIKFLAVLLALVLTVGVVFVGKTTADKALEAAGQTQQGGTSTEGGDAIVNGGEGTVIPDDGNGDVIVDETPSGDETATPGDETATPGDEAEKPAGFSKANAHESFNKWTANAAKMSYKFKRVSAYTPNGAIDVGSATGTLNKIIQGIDENSSLDSVVGGFLGIGNRDGEVKNGVIPEGMNQNYALKAMALTAADIKVATVNGNTYKIQINDCTNPQKDGKNALSRATNDFFTHAEVVKGISDFTTLIKVNETNVQYKGIVLTAVVEGDALKSLELSYTFAAQLQLKAVVPINGKGEATNKLTYTF